MDIFNKYTVSNNVIEEVDKIKDLRVCFDSRLKFAEHNRYKNKWSLSNIGNNKKK